MRSLYNYIIINMLINMLIIYVFGFFDIEGF